MHINLKRAALAVAVVSMASANTWGIKAFPQPITITQPDGSTLTVRLHGDENFHYTTTTDGFLIKCDKDGYFKYVSSNSQSKVTVLKQRANNPEKRSTEELKTLEGLKPIRSAEALKDFFPDSKAIIKKGPEQVLNLNKLKNYQTNQAKAGSNGESEYLVVLVKYADGTLHYTTGDFERWLNEPGYAVDGGTGSVKDYYRDNSMGQFIPNFTVLGPYTLDHEETYYAANSPETGSDVNPEAMIIEAVNKAKADHPEINFSKFDNDGDGYMDNVNIIYSGYGEAASGNERNMWPHSYRLSATNQQFQVDGITVNNYSVSAELVGGSGNKMDGIGTFTHEFGHILGLKDMYDTDDYENGLGINPGGYSLYASGSYNNNSRTPPYLMAFERQQMGWLTLTPLKEPEDVVLKPIYTNTARYIDAQPNLNWETDGGDWFVLENRQQTGWDTYIPAHGLLIYHYDYTKKSQESLWSVNGPNNNTLHRCLYIVPADGIDDDLTRNGDTYPGITGSTEFTNETHPEAVSWTGEKLRTPITEITEDADGNIRFLAKGGTGTNSFIKTIPPTDADISSNTITISSKVTEKKQAIKEMGFCWSSTNNYPTTADQSIKVDVADQQTTQLTKLLPATTYYVRAYMVMDNEDSVYGAVIPVKTEHETIQAPHSFSFTTWNGNEPEGWRIKDNNGDGITWVFDKSTGAIVYQFDYWNNADDWLVSEKMHIPERGSLYLVRGVTNPDCVERLDIMVSTKSRTLTDFHLVKTLTLADQFNEQAVDEIDLSDYANEDVYVAIVAKSEKLQNSIWLWGVYLTNRLNTPTITNFSPIDQGLHVDWTPVEGAKSYYLDFFEVTDTTKVTTKFLPEDDLNAINGDVETGTGYLKFTQTSSVETIAYPDSIKGLQYVQLVSGPRGTSILSFEGSNDGEKWERIGELQRLSTNDSEGTLVDLTPYLKGKVYNRIRIRCDYDGRLVNIRNLTITYNDGKVWKSLASGRVDDTGMDIKETTADEFKSGKKYAVEVYAGDGLLFYDASSPMFYQYGTEGIEYIQSNGTDKTKTARTLCINGRANMSNLMPNRRTFVYSVDGRLLMSFMPITTTTTVSLQGYEGIVIYRQQ